MRVRFGDCTFDSETREFFRRGDPVHLSPKAFRLLELLIEARPRALAKADLLQQIWPETFVTEGNLATLAAEVRGAVGEKAGASGPIRTVYAYGYAFSGKAVEEASHAAPSRAPRQWLVWNKQELPLTEGDNVIGRDADASLRIDDTTVSRRHARILVSGVESRLEDLESKNGTFLGGKPVKAPIRLSDGDEIKVGSVSLTYRVSLPEGTTDTIQER